MRATNWVGDAVMSLPALRALRERFPARRNLDSREAVGGRSLSAASRSAIALIPYTPPISRRNGAPRALCALNISTARFFCRTPSKPPPSRFWRGIPERIGYARDGRSALLTRAIPVPRAGEIPRHERFYYLELLRRAGILDTLPGDDPSVWTARRPRAHARPRRDFANSAWATS